VKCELWLMLQRRGVLAVKTVSAAAASMLGLPIGGCYGCDVLGFSMEGTR